MAKCFGKLSIKIKNFMTQKLFIVSCELTSGFSLNLAKKSKGVFGSLNDEDFLSPISNVLGIWDKIKDVSSDFNFQISSEIIFCAHLLGGKNKKRSSTDFTPTGNVTDQFFVKDTIVGSNLSTQNTRLFDLRENIDFGKIQILNMIKSDGNLVDGYQVGIVSIFSAENPSNIIKFQQKVSTSVSGKGNATISFIEIEESRNISFSGISVDSKKITGKLSGDYSDKRPLSEIRSGMVILAEHFSDVCGDASLKKLLDNQNRENLIQNNSISKNQTSSDIIDKSNYPENRKLLERLTWEEVGSYKYKSEISTSYIESGVSVEDFCNEYEISKEELIAFVNETHPGVLVNGENRGKFNSIFFISLVKIDAAGWTEPLNKPDLLVMQNIDTDYCEFLIDTSRNSMFKSTEDGQRSSIEKLVTVYDALDELTNIHPELNEEIAIELFAGSLDGDTNDFEYESDLNTEIIEESSTKTENFKGKIGIRIAKIDGVKISKSKALINIDGSEYNSIDEITSFLMDHGNIQYTFVTDE